MFSVQFNDLLNPGMWHLVDYPTESAARAAIEQHWDNNGTCRGDVVCKCNGRGNDVFPDTECHLCGYWHPDIRAWTFGVEVAQ